MEFIIIYTAFAWLGVLSAVVFVLMMGDHTHRR